MSSHRQKQSCKNSQKNKNIPYRVKDTKAKQPEPEIEVEDELVIDDDDLDLIDCGDRQKYIIITVIYDLYLI